MTTDPYDGYVEALLGLARSAEGSVLPINEDFYELIESTVADFESDLLALAKRTWKSRAEFEQRLGKEHSGNFQALDAMLAVSYAIGRLHVTGFAQEECKPPDAVRYAASLLITRAISVGHEICAMLRAGFPNGALARWRTLYELDVVAAVLEKGNRWTAARYVNHRWVLVAKKPRDYFPNEEEWEGIRSQLQRRSKALVRRYGAVYATTYGWAAELSKRKIQVESRSSGIWRG